MGCDDNEDSDPFEVVHQEEIAIKTVADRHDRVGAAARVVLALSQNERPDITDLEAVGIPVGPTGDFAEDKDRKK